MCVFASTLWFVQINQSLATILTGTDISVAVQIPIGWKFCHFERVFAGLVMDFLLLTNGENVIETCSLSSQQEKDTEEPREQTIADRKKIFPARLTQRMNIQSIHVR